MMFCLECHMDVRSLLVPSLQWVRGSLDAEKLDIDLAR